MKSYPRRTGSKRAPRPPPWLEVFTIYSLSQLERTIGGVRGGHIYGQTILKIKNKGEKEKGRWADSVAYSWKWMDQWWIYVYYIMKNSTSLVNIVQTPWMDGWFVWKKTPKKICYFVWKKERRKKNKRNIVFRGKVFLFKGMKRKGVGD